MTASQTLLDALNSLFSRKYHSLARYILDARPYVPAGQESALQSLAAIADADQRFADRLAETIESLGGVPQLAPFHSDVASLNYLALDYLIRILKKNLQAEQADAVQARKLAEGEAASEALSLLSELSTATTAQLTTL